MKKISSILILFLLLSSLTHASLNESEVKTKTDNLRESILSEIYLLNQNYLKMKDYRFRLIECLYNPLWASRIKENDSFSPAVREQGAILRARYEGDADSYESLAMSVEKDIRQSMRLILKYLDEAHTICSSQAYHYCMDSWHHQTKGHLAQISKIFKKTSETYRVMQGSALKSLRENPSEHYRFPDRYEDSLKDIESKYYPSYINTVRLLKEQVEFQWPLECQSRCFGRAAEISDDPVLNTIKPDVHGEHGVDGNIVHQDDFGKAIDENNQ